MIDTETELCGTTLGSDQCRYSQHTREKIGKCLGEAAHVNLLLALFDGESNMIRFEDLVLHVKPVWKYDSRCVRPWPEAVKKTMTDGLDERLVRVQSEEILESGDKDGSNDGKEIAVF